MGTVKQGDPEAAPAAAPAPRRSLKLPARFASRYAIIGVWIAMAAIYTAKEGRLFFSWGIFHTIFSQQESLVFMTMALLCTICVGEFVDLSVPAVFGFSATILPVLTVFHGWNVWLAALVAVLGGVAAGAINAYFVVKLGVNTIVVTLGMSTLLEGLSLLISSDNTISGLPAGFQKFATFNVFGLPIAFYYGVVLVLGFAYLLAFTPLGRHMRFVGASREVSRLSGVRVNRIRFGSFVFAGLLAGLGAVITVAHVGSYTASTTDTNLLPVFASVFLGTAVIETGRFNAIGTWIAIYFLQTGITGLQLLNGAVWIAPVFYGAVLVIAVTVSTVLHRRSS
jgi:ribose transport system permease protein